MKLKLLSSLAVLVAVMVTVFLSESSHRAQINIFWDTVIVFFGFLLSARYISIYKKTSELSAIVLVGLFTMIATIHALRFFFGGLPV